MTTQVRYLEPPPKLGVDPASDISSWLISCIAELSDLPKEEIDADMPFEYFGLDSVSALELIAAIEEWLGEELSPALPLDYPTVRQLSEFLASRSHPATAS